MKRLPQICDADQAGNDTVRNHTVSGIFFLLMLFVVFVPARATEFKNSRTKSTKSTLLSVGQTFQAVDSLDVSLKGTGNATKDVKKYLDGLAWPKQEFEVVIDQADPRRGDYLIRFPSPVVAEESGDDTVTMEWYPAKDSQGQIIHAPAIVVVHESGSGMTVGQLFAKTLQRQQFHTFLVHLPGYGKRKTKDRRDVSELVTLFHQAICDVRRARDAVAVLPMVDERLIALQGTSLGGFVSATVAGLDQGYDAVFLMLAGGDLYDILLHGKRDAEKVLEKTREAGINDEQLKKIIDQIEPLNFAPRINAKRVWLYTGIYDTVVPLRNANLLADAANLSRENHFLMPANHYSGIIYLPLIFRHIGIQINQVARTIGIDEAERADAR